MKHTFAPLAILLAVCLLFFWPIFKGYIPFPGDLLIDSNPYRSISFMGYTPGSYPNKAQGMDVITELYPWRYFTIQEFKQGRIPFWNPHNFSGNIHMQNFQSSIFSPFNLFFFIFPFANGWTLFILIQPILASIFFYLFARELKIGKFASVIGGIGFAFSSYMTVWIEYGNIAATLAYLPLLLFFLLRFFKTHSKRSYAGFVFSATVMLLSGYIQGAFYSYVVAALFTIALCVRYKSSHVIKQIIFLISMFVFPVLLVSFQLLPTVQVFSFSSRWPYSVKQFQEMLQPAWYWITLFSSDFFGNPAARNYYLSTTYIERVAYVGVPLLFFALYGLFQRRKLTLFFGLLAGVIMLLVTNLPGIAFLYQLPIPVINTTVPTRVLSIFMFAAVILSAIGIDSLFKDKKKPKVLLWGFLGIYVCMWIGVFVAKKVFPQVSMQIEVTQHNLILPTVLAVATGMIFLAPKKFAAFAKAGLFILIIVDLFYVFAKITPFAPSATAYPQTPVISFLQKNSGINRYWGYGSGYIFPNISTVDQTFSPEGNDPLHMKNYGELVTSSYDGKLPVLPPRPDANLAAGYGQEGMKNSYRQKLLNLLGVKYIVQHDEIIQDGNADAATFPKETYSLVWSQNPWQVYENKNVLPRYFLVNSYKIATGQKALSLLYSSDVSKTIVVDKLPSIQPDGKANGQVKLISYAPQKITFTTNTTGSMLLFLSDTYYPSWKATIDEKETPVLLADYAFRAVSVPAGKHTIYMYYQPKEFHIGILIAGVSFVVFLLVLMSLKPYENKK